MKSSILVVAAVLSTAFAATAHDEKASEQVNVPVDVTYDEQASAEQASADEGLTGNTSSASRSWARALFAIDWAPSINFHDSPTASLTAFDWAPSIGADGWRDELRLDWEPGFTPGTDFSYDWEPGISAEH